MVRVPHDDGVLHIRVGEMMRKDGKILTAGYENDLTATKQRVAEFGAGLRFMAIKVFFNNAVQPVIAHKGNLQSRTGGIAVACVRTFSIATRLPQPP